MAVAGALIDRLSLTIVNALTASVALGSAYYIHLYDLILMKFENLSPFVRFTDFFLPLLA